MVADHASAAPRTHGNVTLRSFARALRVLAVALRVLPGVYRVIQWRRVAGLRRDGLLDLVDAVGILRDVAVVRTPAADLGACTVCPDDDAWPALDAEAVIAHRGDGETAPTCDEVCSGCVTTVVGRATRAGRTVAIAVPR